MRDRNVAPVDFRNDLATVEDTALVTAILEAGRRSLDAGGAMHRIDYSSDGAVTGLSQI
jgi:D-galacturonate reductase